MSSVSPAVEFLPFSLMVVSKLIPRVRVKKLAEVVENILVDVMYWTSTSFKDGVLAPIDEEIRKTRSKIMLILTCIVFFV